MPSHLITDMNADSQIPLDGMDAVQVCYEVQPTGFNVTWGTRAEHNRYVANEVGTRPREVAAELDAGAMKIIVSSEAGADPTAVITVGLKGILLQHGDGASVCIIPSNGDPVRFLDLTDGFEQMDRLREEIGLPTQGHLIARNP